MPRERKSNFGLIVIACILGFAVGIFISYMKNQNFDNDIRKNHSYEQQENSSIYGKIRLQGEEPPISSAANRVMPSVVGIVASNFSETYNRYVTEVGSGVIIDDSGIILSNNHVAGYNSRSVNVSLFDGREISAKILWADATLDLSIIKIDLDNLVTSDLGDSDEVLIGETAVAIGNPLGLKFQRSVTAGIISAINRSIEVDKGVFMEDLIQTDASINPGNSGGPLININGEVIGINTVKVKSAEGIGFAAPVNIVKPIIKSIKENGEFRTPIIGIVGLDKNMIGYDGKAFNRGIYIYEVGKNTPAYRGGLKRGDIILSINNIEVNTIVKMKEIFYNQGVGSTVNISVQTAAGVKELKVKLAEAS